MVKCFSFEFESGLSVNDLEDDLKYETWIYESSLEGMLELGRDEHSAVEQQPNSLT